MTDPTPPTPIKPSASTIGSAVGGMLAVFLIMALTHYNVPVDATQGTIIGAGMAALAGYFFNGGKSADTE